MEALIEQLANCVEFGKIDKKAPYPPDMRDKDGADEVTKQCLEAGITPGDILNKALIPAMNKVGTKFSENKIFVPQMLMAAKAMNKSMEHLKPFFLSGEVKRKGTFIIGTVAGDLHDIGKNLVAMMIEGSGWEVIDLGTDVKSDIFISSISKYPGCIIGLSALLTTTMGSMEKICNEIKTSSPNTKVMIGGAPVNDDFCKKIGADFYSPDPQGAVSYLNKI